MESTPKKPTEKIGGQLRKKLPKKSVGLAARQNGFFKKGIGVQRAGLPDCHVRPSASCQYGRSSAELIYENM